MKKIALICLAPVYLLLVAGFSCHSLVHDDNKQVRVYFWKNADPEVTHHLYVDNKLQGVIPFLPDSLTYPGNNNVHEQGLYLSLIPGHYNLVAMNNSGTVLAEGSLKLELDNHSKNISTSWNNDKCKAEMVLND